MGIQKLLDQVPSFGHLSAASRWNLAAPASLLTSSHFSLRTKSSKYFSDNGLPTSSNFTLPALSSRPLGRLCTRPSVAVLAEVVAVVPMGISVGPAHVGPILVLESEESLQETSKTYKNLYN